MKAMFIILAIVLALFGLAWILEEKVLNGK